MNVKVDESLCIGCGLCVDECKELFGMNADGKAIVQTQNLHKEHRNLEEISDMCPVDAILID